MQSRRFSLALATNLFVTVLLVTMLVTIMIAAAQASTEKTIHTFPFPTRGVNPKTPLVADAAGNLYGTSLGGLHNVGVVFELSPQAGGGWQESVLYAFSGGADGGYPQAGLIFDSVGDLYGTTDNGGSSGNGTVFELTPDGRGGWTESVLYSFKGGNDGDYPVSSLILDQAGNLYGTTNSGGGNACNGYGCGTVFELSPSGMGGRWTETVLHAFTFSDGAYPYASVIFDKLGNLYGTTFEGGASGAGTVFKLTAGAGGSWTESVLYSFSGDDGAYPNAGLIMDATGALYGTATSGGGTACFGYNACGVVFELTPNAGGDLNYSVLYRFTGNSDGSFPFAGLVADVAGNLYTASSQKGDTACQCGAVVELTPGMGGGWTSTVIHTFTGGRDGGAPYATPYLDPAGKLDGTASVGGTGGLGAVFQLAQTGGVWKEKVLYFFSQPDGGYPSTGVIFDSAHNLYGATTDGGSHNAGAIFKLTPKKPTGWTETVVYNFKGGKDGANPVGLTFDRVGNIYGTTSAGGKHNAGTVFELKPKAGGWAESVLYSFTAAKLGGYPQSGVIVDELGNLYGTLTSSKVGGHRAGGLVFELTHSMGGWVETVLHRFCRPNYCDDGASLSGSLILDSAGNLYGTTQQGGSNGGGIVFELSLGSNGLWTETILHNFTGQADGAAPGTTLVMDAAGNLYGTTSGGGTHQAGTVFELKSQGGSWTESTLYSFAGGSDGATPFAGVVFDPAGNLFGTSVYGGTGCNGYGCGTVFELKPGGMGGWSESVIYAFTGGNDGIYPRWGVIVSGPNLIGTTQTSADGEGVVFKVTP